MVVTLVWSQRWRRKGRRRRRRRKKKRKRHVKPPISAQLFLLRSLPRRQQGWREGGRTHQG